MKIIKIVLGALVLLILVFFIDKQFLLPKRVIAHNWEASRRDDFIKTGVDVIMKDSYSLSGDTIIVNKNKKFILKYCLFGSLWIRDLNNTYTAHYVYTMSSRDW